MALPKIQQPLFELKLPICGKRIKFRPFLVKEEKILLVGKEADSKQQMLALKQLLKAVVQEPKNFNPTDLILADMEYLFINLRARSVQNIVELKYRDKEDGKVYDFSVNLDELEPEIDPNHKNTIDLDGNIGIKLREPTIGLLEELDIGQADLNDNVYELLAGCIEQVYDSEQVYDEFTKEEAIEFITSLDINMFTKIKDFFDTLPKLTHTFEYVNSSGNNRKIVLQGLQDFF
jgi:hypothetical protein|tara:strand:+ start:1926 stop:2624 length:699 start_codon:yes stop_codon:yes gene_type:complete